MIGDGFASIKSVTWQTITEQQMYLSIPNLLHPSLFVVFKRSSIWKNGIGDVVSDSGAPPGIDATTFSTDHGSSMDEELSIPRVQTVS
jgi:hypothetical protein